MTIRERVFILTGAGSGIGRATAVALAREGARLTLVGRRADPLEETAHLIADAGGDAIIVPADLMQRSTHGEIIKKTLDAFGTLHGLINNAGNVRAGRFTTYSDDEIEAQINLNLEAPIFLTRRALPYILETNDGVIVNVASGAALVGMPFYSVYAAAKSGLARFGEALRELLGEGVHVINVFPAGTDTPMMATNKAGEDLGFGRESPEKVAQAIVEAVRDGALQVVRGGDARRTMIVANQEDPEALDRRFAAIKSKLQDAVSNHKSL